MQRFFLGIVILSIAATAFASDRTPAIGDTVPDLQFKDIRGLQRSLSDLGPKKAYVFVFVTTYCPLVKRTMPKLVELDQRFASKGLQLVAVNVGPDDTIRAMAAQAIEFEASFPFVKDTDLSCKKAMGVERTPEVVVLNADKKLVYRGRIDDQYRLGGSRPEPTRKDLEEAINDVLEDRTVSVAQTPVDGCLITASPSISTNQSAPTFHKDIAPILNRRCVNCHRPDSATPFSLMTYSDAAAHADMVAEVVTDQRMPPWYANPKHGEFQNDPSLTRSERDTLVTWVKTNRTEGDPKDAPSLPEFPQTQWRIGEPDLVISELADHKIQATGYIAYRNILLPYLFLNETWFEAVEIRPDNKSVVHHCNMAYVTPQGATEKNFITGHVPGGPPMDLGKYNNGVAYRIPKMSTLGLQIHYTTTGKEERCRISVALRFPKKKVQKELKFFLLDPHNLNIAPENGAYAIKANTIFDENITLLGLFTHMHVRGKDMTFFAEAPGSSRETLLQIPNYNFGWQLGYEIAPGKKCLSKGSKIEAIAHYDNSTFNPYNPDPKRTVPYGQQTYDEMFNGFGFYVADDQQLNLTVNPKRASRSSLQRDQTDDLALTVGYASA